MWKNTEDVIRSLYEYSHLKYPVTPVPPPKSILKYRARILKTYTPGIYDEQPESREIFISGRGKHHPGIIIRPGEPVTSTPEEDMAIRRKIREVSGLGYSNELSERMYGQDESWSSAEEESEELPSSSSNLKLSSAVKSEKHKRFHHSTNWTTSSESTIVENGNRIYRSENEENKRGKKSTKVVKFSTESSFCYYQEIIPSINN